MIIAVAYSRKDKVWKNIDISWEDFLKRAASTVRTAESTDEYKGMPKHKQDDIKMWEAL